MLSSVPRTGVWGSDYKRKNKCSTRIWKPKLFNIGPSCKSRQSPINFLPVELLEQIFDQYVHWPSGAPGPSSSYRYSTVSSQAEHIVHPMILGHVNRQWRNILRTTSTLWNCIHIAYPKKKSTQFTSFWLELAGQSPLTISLSASGILTTEEVSTINSIMNLLLKHYDRWQDVSIVVSQSNIDAYPFLMAIPTHPPPLLKSSNFNFCNLGNNAERPNDQVVRTLHSSGGLTSVVWGCTWYSIPQVIARFPGWSQLRELVYGTTHGQIKALTVNGAILLLHHCPALESFSATIISPEPEDTTLEMETPFTHFHLRRLSLTLNISLAPHIFAHLQLPMLEDLSLERLAGDFGFLDSAESLLDFLFRSSCALRTFKISSEFTAYHEHIIIHLLAKSPFRRIERLLLGGMTKELINFLTRKEQDLASLEILPFLQRLEFDNHHYLYYQTLNVSTHSVEKMLLSRINKLPTTRVGARLDISMLEHVALGLGDIGFRAYNRLGNLGAGRCRVLPIDRRWVPNEYYPEVL